MQRDAGKYHIEGKIQHDFSERKSWPACLETSLKDSVNMQTVEAQLIQSTWISKGLDKVPYWRLIENKLP